MEKGEAKAERITSLVPLLLSLVALTSSFLLLAGLSYRIGYFSSFGISIGTILLQPSELLGEAFYLGILLLAEIIRHWSWPIYFLLALILLTLLLLIIIKLYRDSTPAVLFRRWLRHHETEAIKPLTIHRFLKVIIEDISAHAGKAYIVILLLFSITIAVVTPYQFGQGEANRQIALFLSLEYDCKRAHEVNLLCGQLIETGNETLLAEGLIVSGSSESHLILF